MIRPWTPRIITLKRIPQSDQLLARDQLSSTSVKHLPTEQFMVQAAAAAPEAERSEALTLEHYQVG